MTNSLRGHKASPTATLNLPCVISPGFYRRGVDKATLISLPWDSNPNMKTLC